ncbi:hypothetical protein XENOCAPTIV_028992 [Xenoophorus captivus]|uniref:Uncharacterized protein n=1 Tax=Xenoophorus captivus TaxID=1517983 RepID=A0ABV0RBZ1_9TELE
MSKTTRNAVKSSMAGEGSKGGEVDTSNPAGLTHDQAISAFLETTDVAASCVPSEVAKQLAKLSALIVGKCESQDKKLEEIWKTTNATESKTANIVSWITEMEDLLCFWEDAH